MATIAMTPVKTSSNVVAYGYDARAKILIVQFKSQRTYRYDAVPPTLFKKLQAAESKGGFIAQHVVKGDFKATLQD